MRRAGGEVPAPHQQAGGANGRPSVGSAVHPGTARVSGGPVHCRRRQSWERGPSGHMDGQLIVRRCGIGRDRRVATRSRMDTYQLITGHICPPDHYRHIGQLRDVNAVSSPRKVLHVGVSAKCVAIDGVGGRYRIRPRGGARTSCKRHTVRGTRGERGSSRRAPGHARAPAGRAAADRAPAHPHE